MNISSMNVCARDWKKNDFETWLFKLETCLHEEVFFILMQRKKEKNVYRKFAFKKKMYPS